MCGDCRDRGGRAMKGEVGPAKLNARWRKALESVFAREIAGTLPHQSRSSVFTELENEGMVEKHKERFGGRFPVVVEGWVLTHRGRMAYCDWASLQPNTEDE